MNKKNINKGFTLIELLVVIAIVGILSGLIIVSLGDATNQAKEAKIKSALDQLRPVAQLHANSSTSHNFDGLTTDAKVVNIYQDMLAQGVRYYDGSTLKTPTGIGDLITEGDTVWCAYAVTPNNNSCMCVDSTGAVKENTAGNTTGTECKCASNACPN